MDLYAYLLKDLLKDLLPSEPPRPRGIRLMKIDEVTDGGKIHDKYKGQDVIYIHTRCGGNNYEPCGMDEWEKSLGDLFLEGVDDRFDSTYRDTYIKVPKDKLSLYKDKLKELESIIENN